MTSFQVYDLVPLFNPLCLVYSPNLQKVGLDFERYLLISSKQETKVGFLLDGKVQGYLGVLLQYLTQLYFMAGSS